MWKREGKDFGRSRRKSEQGFVYGVLQESHLQFSAVTLLSLLHVAIATFLPAVQHLHLGHVEQTHPNALFKTGRQVFFAAAAEHSGERIPASEKEKSGE